MDRFIAVTEGLSDPAEMVEDYTTTGADAGTVACIVRDLRQLSAVKEQL